MPANAVSVMAKNRRVRRYWIERGPGTSALRVWLLLALVAEAVAHAAHGEDVLRLLGVALELLAQMADVHVDRAWIAIRRVAPHALEQHVPREHPPRRSRQRAEDLELDICCLHIGLAHAHAPLGEVHLELPHRQRRVVARGLCRTAHVGT